MQLWPRVEAAAIGPNESQFTIGESAAVTAQVALGKLTPKDVLVEIVHGEDRGGAMAHPLDVVMQPTVADKQIQVYEGNFQPQHTGAQIYGERVLPYHPDMLNKHELGLALWAR